VVNLGPRVQAVQLNIQVVPQCSSKPRVVDKVRCRPASAVFLCWPLHNMVGLTAKGDHCVIPGIMPPCHDAIYPAIHCTQRPATRFVAYHFAGPTFWRIWIIVLWKDNGQCVALKGHRQ
jgi:hypothetical protein